MSSPPPGRDAYVVVGAAMRRSIRRAAKANLGPRQLVTLLAVFEMTASYSKLTDRLYLAQLAEVVFDTPEPNAKQVKRVGEDLRSLAEAGIIDREPPKPGRPGRNSGGASYRVGLPQAVNGPAVGTVTPPLKRSLAQDRLPLETVPSAGPNTPRNGPTGGGPTEKQNEKTYLTEKETGDRSSSRGLTTPAPEPQPDDDRASSALPAGDDDPRVAAALHCAAQRDLAARQATPGLTRIGSTRRWLEAAQRDRAEAGDSERLTHLAAEHPDATPDQLAQLLAETTEQAALAKAVDAGVWTPPAPTRAQPSDVVVDDTPYVPPPKSCMDGARDALREGLAEVASG